MDTKAPQDPPAKHSGKDQKQSLEASISQWRDAFKRRLDDRDNNRLQLPLV